MKNLFKVLGIGILSIMLMSGCATTPTDNQTVEDAIVIVKNVAESGVVIALDKQPDVRKYFTVAVTGLDIFTSGKNLKPNDLYNMLIALDVEEVKKVEVRVVINSFCTIYEIYFNRWANGYVSDDLIVAKRFLVALKEGIERGLVQ